GGVREAVAGPDHERFEGEAGIQLALEPGARAARGGPSVRPWIGGRLGRRRDRLVRGPADRGALAEDLGEALAQDRKVVFVDPVHEERVGNFELDASGRQLARHDRLEPGFERLLALKPRADRGENL